MNKKILLILLPITVILLIGLILLFCLLFNNSGDTQPTDTTNTPTVSDDVLDDNILHIKDEIKINAKEILTLTTESIDNKNSAKVIITLYENGQVLKTNIFPDGTKIHLQNSINPEQFSTITNLCKNVKSCSLPSNQCSVGNIHTITIKEQNITMKTCGPCSQETIELFFKIQNILLGAD